MAGHVVSWLPVPYGQLSPLTPETNNHMPQLAFTPRSIRQLIARSFETVRFRDPLSDTDLYCYADIGCDPHDGDSVIVTDGCDIWRCRYAANIPLPDGLRIIGRSLAIIIPE